MTEKNGAAGSVLSLQLCSGHRKSMRRVEVALAVENLGLAQDAHALKDSSRQVLLIDEETLNALGLAPGDVRENLTTGGLSLKALRYRDRLRIGSEAIVEMTQPCLPCKRMEEIRPGLSRELDGRRGMLARVIKGGTIRCGDIITLLVRE